MNRAENSHATLAAHGLKQVWHLCNQMHDHVSIPMAPIVRGNGAWLIDPGFTHEPAIRVTAGLVYIASRRLDRLPGADPFALRYAGVFASKHRMRTIRLHADLPLAVGSELALPPQASEHAARVLRLTAGDPLTLFNGDGCDYQASICAIDKRTVTVRVASRQSLQNESPLPLVLAQGIARGDKMDLIVQKATELGVVRIVPLLTERSEVRLDDARASKRVSHWRSVAISACEQCGRARIPEIQPIQTLAGWLDDLPDDNALRLALMPQAKDTIHALRFGDAGGVLMVGPEGGLGETDIRALEQRRFHGLRLGPRILRTETAGLAALSALQACHGDLR